MPDHTQQTLCDQTLKKKKTLWPLFMDGVQLPQGYSHFEEAVYFLPLSSAIFQKSEFLCKSYERQVSDSQ